MLGQLRSTPVGRWAASLVAVGLLLSIAVPPLSAQNTAPQDGSPLSVGIYESPPFVMFDDSGAPEGLALDLWTLLADDLGLETEFIPFDTIREMTDAVVAEEIDVAVTNLTITEDRILRMDLTQPWFNAGLRIMTYGDGATGWRAFVNGMSDAGHLEAYAWLAFVILLGTLAFTIFDRAFDKEFHPRWRDGIAHSFHTVMTIATAGKMPSRKNLFGWIGRIGQAFWLIFGLAVVAYVTSSITSVMTTLAITEEINGPEDLPGARIGVFDGSTAQQFGELRGYDLRPYAGIESAVADLVNGDLDAIVADAPVLEYFAIQNEDLALNVVGPMFEPDRYGFALPQGSALTAPLTAGLLRFWEDGTIRGLDTDYFGHEW